MGFAKFFLSYSYFLADICCPWTTVGHLSTSISAGTCWKNANTHIQCAVSQPLVQFLGIAIDEAAEVRSSLAFPSSGRTLLHGSHNRAVGALANKSLLISASRASFWSLKNLGMSFWSKSRTWIAHHASLVYVFLPFTPNQRDNWFQPILACINHLLVYPQICLLNPVYSGVCCKNSGSAQPWCGLNLGQSWGCKFQICFISLFSQFSSTIWENNINSCCLLSA